MFKNLGPLQNLTVHINTTVTKLLSGGQDDNGDLIITGVKATRVDGDGVTTNWKYLANKAVVLAAGAYKSPQILMVSGIGDPDVLNAAGIDVKKRLRGVGKNFKDHYALPIIFNVSQISQINNATFFEEQAVQYSIDQTGYFAYPTFDHAAVQASTDNAFNGRKPDVVLTTSPINIFTGDPYQMGAIVVLQNPESTGTVTVTSDDINDPPVIDLNYFSVANDLVRLKAGLNLMRSILTQPSFSSWYTTEYFPTEFAPDDFIKSSVVTADHPMGTCMMGRKSDPDAVVDNEGAVFKTNRLYIADASVIPTKGDATPNVSIHGTVILIAKIIANNLMCKFANVCL
jgi:choline dehydrogenase-like flavoprotein